MTQGTESARVEQVGPKLKLAREIAARLYCEYENTQNRMIAGEFDTWPSVQMAVAAIEATTEAAAKLADDWEMSCSLSIAADIAAGLRADRHLEPRYD